MRFLIAFAWIVFVALPAFPQAENSSFNLTGRAGAATAFAKDYQSIGINPANLGFLSEYEGKKVTFGLGEGGMSFYSSALNTSQLTGSLLDFGATKFTYKEKQEAAKLFANKPISFNIDYMLVGVSVQIDKIGGFAFNVRDKLQIYASFSERAADLLFMGRASTQNFDVLSYSSLNTYQLNVTFPNRPPSNGYSNDTLNRIVSGTSTAPGTISQALNGSKINAQWTREFNLAYGNRILKLDAFEIYGGVGLRYILGYASVNLEAKNNTFIDSYASFSPGMDIKIGKAGEANPSAISGGFFTPSGQGFGADLGLTLKYEGLTVGASLVNIGSMTWNGNVYLPKDTILKSMSGIGIQNYNLLNQTDQFTSDQEGSIKWRGSSSKTLALPSIFRAGVNYRLKNILDVGADVILPLNKVTGSLASVQYNFGADIKVTKWFRVSTGFSTGGNTIGKYNVPLGILFVVGMNGFYEFGFATRDITTFILQNNPNVSLTSGFLRFRF
ncbi:MAG: hypothetical protein K2Q22_15745 [Cytophagales bacterium]|nr:hypothetical protein [Cytophagales bacterium]